MSERECLECGEPVVNREGLLCERCATALMPDLSRNQIAVIGMAALALLRELEDTTLPGLRANGLDQTAADVDSLADELLLTLDPLLENGANAVHRTALDESP